MENHTFGNPRELCPDTLKYKGKALPGNQLFIGIVALPCVKYCVSSLLLHLRYTSYKAHQGATLRDFYCKRGVAGKKQAR